MLKINKNNAIVGLLGFLPALLTTRLTSLGDILIFYVIMLAYTAFFVFCKEEVFPYENEGEYVPVSRSRIHFAWGADWLVFLVFIFIYTRFLKLFPASPSKNYIIPLNYIVMMQNILARSIGFRIFHLYPANRTLQEKLKILAINFFLMSSWYLAMFRSVWNCPSESVMKAVGSLLITAFFINYAVRLNVFKQESLCERIMGIRTMKFVPKRERLECA